MKAASRLVAKVIMIVILTNGVIEAVAKILVPILVLVVKMPNVACYIIKHYVLALVEVLEIPELNVSVMLMSANPILVAPMPDVLIWLELTNVNANLDVEATPRQDVLVLRPRLTDANSNNVDLMPSANLKMELENAIVQLDSLMEIQNKVAHLDLEVRSYFIVLVYSPPLCTM